MILSFFFHFYSLVILLVSLFCSCFRYFDVFINFIGDTFKIIVKRYCIALEIALYKFIIIIIIIIYHFGDYIVPSKQAFPCTGPAHAQA